MAYQKQVICMRTDLNMRKGKMIAQGAHASMIVLSKCIRRDEDECLGETANHIDYVIELPHPVDEWLKGAFTKIALGVGSEEELLNLYNQAKDAGIPCSLVTDNGQTEFHGVPTRTCIAIGPEDNEVIDQITGHLKLL